MRKLFLLGVLMTSFALPSLSQAADGSSGCGPGWFILKDESLVSSALRATTNASLFPVTTIGMTVGTSNCTKHSIVLNEKQSLHFATQNYYEIMSEGARGEGTYLSAFADVIGCQKSMRHDFSVKVQQSYDKVFSDSQRRPENMLIEVYKIILQDPSLTRACSLG